MSRVGNSPINLSEGTMVTISNNIVTVKGGGGLTITATGF